MSAKLRQEITLTVGAVVAALEAAQAILIDVKWLHVVAAVLIAAAGALGLRGKVSPA